MNKLTVWVKRNQITAFFLITFTITWGLGFSLDAVMNKGIFLLAPLVINATCGPALAGIMISAIGNTQPREGTKRTYWIAFLIAWAVSALVFIAHNTFINHAPLNPVMIGFALVSVLPVAFVISMVQSRLPAVKRYLASLVQIRNMWGWSLLALFLTPALVLLSILISSLLGRQPITAHQFPETGLVLIGMVAVKFFYQFFFFNATGEEIGWRGFALPRLQSRMSPLIACLIMNIFWVMWHVFLWMAEGKPIFSAEYWVQTYLELLPATVTLVWFYNRSQGSILVAGIAHAAANTAYAFFPNLDWKVFNWTVAAAALVLIAVDHMWKKHPSDHPAVFSSPVKLEPKEDSVFPSTESPQEKLVYQLPEEKNVSY